MIAMRAMGRGRQPVLILWSGRAAGLVTCILVGWLVQASARPVLQAERAYWSPSGRPCPPAAAFTFPRSGPPLDQQFVFEDMHFARSAGAADCRGLLEGGPFNRSEALVCQFDHPINLEVRVRDHAWRFSIGFGDPATVTLRKGALRCVLASNFRG